MERTSAHFLNLGALFTGRSNLRKIEGVATFGLLGRALVVIIATEQIVGRERRGRASHHNWSGEG
jgi:hypothetical protein